MSRTLARAIIGGVVYLTGVGLLAYAIPAESDSYLPGGLLAGLGAGLQGPALLKLARARARRRNKQSIYSNIGPAPRDASLRPAGSSQSS
jgi:hypothetical protein